MDAAVRQRLKQQTLAAEYKLDRDGRRVVEAKAVTKGKIGRSPDDMDALNLAYADGHQFEVPSGMVDPIV